MQFFLKLIFSIFGIDFGVEAEKDPLAKEFDYEDIEERRKELDDKYGDFRRTFPKLELTKTISRMENADFGEDEVVMIAENILHYQNPDGGWGKSGNYRVDHSKKQLKKIYEEPREAEYERDTSDFDNGCTWGHIEYLSYVYEITRDKKIRTGIKKALKNIVDSQHPNGSWENKNHRHVTYNDGVMQGILTTLLSIIRNVGGKYDYLDDIVDELDLKRVYRRGLDCVLATQIEKDGELHIWAQQHDHDTLEPTWARSYEMPAYATSESVSVIIFLQKHLEYKPADREVRKSIDAALKFLQKIKLPEEQGDPGRRGYWARYHDLETLKPIFANRDSKIVHRIEDLDDERRYGYSWYNNSALKVL